MSADLNSPSAASSPSSPNPSTPFDPLHTNANECKLPAPICPSVVIPPLTQQQLTAIDLLISGRTQRAVAKALSVHPATLWRWLHYHPLFQSTLAQRRQEFWGAAADRFRKTLLRALKQLDKQVKDRWQETSFRASKAILSLAGAKRLAPDAAPTDPQSYINAFARSRSPDPNLSPDLSQQMAALAEMLRLADAPDAE